MKRDAQQQLNRWFERFEKRMDERVPAIVAETATEFFQDSFERQSWNNVPWPALNPKYAARKTRGAGRILIRTVALLNSIRPTTVNANKVVISAGNSLVQYARVHNEGLQVRGIRNVRPFVNTNFMGTGRRVQIKAHTRRVNFVMPRRQFMGQSLLLNRAIITRLKAAL